MYALGQIPQPRTKNGIRRGRVTKVVLSEVHVQPEGTIGEAFVEVYTLDRLPGKPSRVVVNEVIDIPRREGTRSVSCMLQSA